jgi:hypothetical protein
MPNSRVRPVVSRFERGGGRPATFATFAHRSAPRRRLPEPQALRPEEPRPVQSRHRRTIDEPSLRRRLNQAHDASPRRALQHQHLPVPSSRRLKRSQSHHAHDQLVRHRQPRRTRRDLVLHGLEGRMSRFPLPLADFWRNRVVRLSRAWRRCAEDREGA